MARPKPNPDDICPLIIEQAVKLIQERGFDNLTMKALAVECGMSVGKLYHFFPSKDDLFLQLEIEYFDGFRMALEDRFPSEDDWTVSQFRHFLQGYYDYATSHFDLYQLVTSPPKVYTHYIGTGSENLAREELSSALKVISFVRHTFKRTLASAGVFLDAESLQRRFLMLVNAVHGLIMMSRSAAWPYISVQVENESDLGRNEKDLAEIVGEQLDLLLKTICRE